jgi:hypothetical protein
MSRPLNFTPFCNSTSKPRRLPISTVPNFNARPHDNLADWKNCVVSEGKARCEQIFIASYL